MCAMTQMSSLTGLRFLRPYLQQDLPVVRHAAYLRFFSTTRSCLSSKQKKAQDEPGIKRNKVAIKSDVLAFGSLRNVVNLGREGTAAVDGVVEGIECRGKGPVEERREGKLRRKESENIRREKVKAEVRRARERDIVVMMRKAKELGLGDVVRGLDSELKLQEEKVEDPIGEEEVEHVDKEEVGGGKKAGDV